MAIEAPCENLAGERKCPPANSKLMYAMIIKGFVPAGMGVVGAALIVCTSCQRSATRTIGQSNDIKQNLQVENTTLEKPRVAREFHVLDVMIGEYDRLQAAPASEDSKRKTAMLTAQIQISSRQLEARQDAMNAEERRILAKSIAVSGSN